MAHRKKIGDLYAIPLSNGTYAFCRVLQGVNVSFYTHRGISADDLPNDENYEFTVCVYKDCFKEWQFVENRPFEKEEDSKPPKYRHKDVLTGRYNIYENGTFIPCTEDECKDLEVIAVWSNIHLQRRLIGDESWKRWFPGFYDC